MMTDVIVTVRSYWHWQALTQCPWCLRKGERHTQGGHWVETRLISGRCFCKTRNIKGGQQRESRGGLSSAASEGTQAKLLASRTGREGLRVQTHTAYGAQQPGARERFSPQSLTYHRPSTSLLPQTRAHLCMFREAGQAYVRMARSRVERRFLWKPVQQE